MGRYLMEYFPNELEEGALDALRERIGDGFRWGSFFPISFKEDFQREYLNQVHEWGSWFAIETGWLNSHFMREHLEEHGERFHEIMQSRDVSLLTDFLTEYLELKPDEPRFAFARVNLETYEVEYFSRQDEEVFTSDGYFYFIE